MPNRDTHFKVGAITGAVSYLILNYLSGEKSNLMDLSGVGLLSGCAALTPDIIEPSTNPRHRSICHSVGFSAVAIPKISKSIDANQTLTIKQKNKFQSILLGYGSHLALDVRTPAGLPLLG